MERTLKLFKNGGSQALRLPREFRFAGREVIAKKLGGVVYLIPKRFRKGEFLRLLEEVGPVELAPRQQPGWTDRRSNPGLRVAKRRKRARS